MFSLFSHSLIHMKDILSCLHTDGKFSFKSYTSCGNSPAICHQEPDLCLHKNPSPDVQMCWAPAYEENGGASRSKHAVRFSEWRGLNCSIFFWRKSWLFPFSDLYYILCSYQGTFYPYSLISLYAEPGGCTGFDRDPEDGEAIRRQMRQIAKLKLNANDNYELAAA